MVCKKDGSVHGVYQKKMSALEAAAVSFPIKDDFV